MEEAISDSTRLLMNAVQYLSMANLVIETDDFRNNPRRYNRPLLNTLAVGVELFLKYAHTLHDQSIEDVAQRYRHNLWRLWRECPEPELIEMVLQTAERFHAHACLERLAELVDDIPAEFIKALKNLSKLHTAGGSQLRYLAPAGTLATAPGWLTQVFYHVADACLRRPPFG